MPLVSGSVFNFNLRVRLYRNTVSIGRKGSNIDLLESLGLITQVESQIHRQSCALMVTDTIGIAPAGSIVTVSQFHSFYIRMVVMKIAESSVGSTVFERSGIF